MRGIKVGNGILEQIKESVHNFTFTVETLYELISQDDWFILDFLFRDREDLQERIKKIKGKYDNKRKNCRKRRH